MTTQEMHIGIDLDLQVINSQVTKNILPQEKDWFLNQEVHKYINQRISKQSNIKGTGFQDTTKRIKDLKDFVKTENNIPVLTNSLGERYINLPPDYYEYITSSAKVAKNCGQTLKDTTVNKYKTIFNLNLPNSVSLTSYTISLTTSLGTTEIFNIANLPSNYLVNDEFRKQKFLLIKALKIQLKDKIEEALNSPVSLYWEFQGYDYKKESFILITSVPLINISVTVNAGTSVVNTPTTYETKTYTNTELPLISAISLVDKEFEVDISKSYLSGSKPHSLTSTLQNDILLLSVPNSVIIGSVNLSYICKPNLIDLYLNSNLNASRKVCEEIVSNTVRVLKSIIQDNNYESYVKENMLIE